VKGKASILSSNESTKLSRHNKSWLTTLSAYILWAQIHTGAESARKSEEHLQVSGAGVVSTVMTCGVEDVLLIGWALISYSSNYVLRMVACLIVPCGWLMGYINTVLVQNSLLPGARSTSPHSFLTTLTDRRWSEFDASGDESTQFIGALIIAFSNSRAQLQILQGVKRSNPHIWRRRCSTR
jgi:hypothetical protein